MRGQYDLLIGLLFCFFLCIVDATSKRFIFRLDDIEDWYNSATQVALLDFFVDRGYGLSAGIIGQYFNGADTNLYNALWRCVNAGADKCAIFNHGWDDSFEFATANSVAQARTPIQNCETKIKTYFPGYNLEVFVPHQNSWNKHTLTALRQLGYKVASASSLPYSNMAWDLTKTPMQMPEQTTTGTYSWGNWVTYPIASAVSDCNAAAARGEVCVIMIHPHEFANGQYTLGMLQELIDTLIGQGFTSTNYHTVIKEVTSPLLTNEPTMSPSLFPTKNPTPFPSKSPTNSPSPAPSLLPTQVPSWLPSVSPSREPSKPPTRPPSPFPSQAPSAFQSASPTTSPTISLTSSPSVASTANPTSTMLTQTPTIEPTIRATIDSTPESTPVNSHSLRPTVSPTTRSTTTQSSPASVAPSNPIEGKDEPVHPSPSSLPTEAPTINAGGSTNSNSNTNSSRDEFKPSSAVMAGIICAGIVILGALGIGSWYAYSNHFIRKNEKLPQGDIEEKSVSTSDDESTNQSIKLDAEDKSIPERLRRGSSYIVDVV